jgi:hypothetical protein
MPITATMIQVVRGLRVELAMVLSGVRRKESTSK